MDKKKTVFLKKMNTVEVEAAVRNSSVLFLPVGTLEAHGRHLPVGTDTLCAEAVSEGLARRLGGLVAPSVEYGITNVLAQTSPASFFPDHVFEEFVETIIKNFVLQGFKKIIVLNGHGGNRDCLKRIARRQVRSSQIALAVINWWLISEKFVGEVFDDSPGGHAAIEETALIQHYYPELVNPENYSSEQDTYVPDDGMWLYPPPGEIILHHQNHGLPDFNSEKCGKFAEILENELEKGLRRWIASFSRIKGGLRP